MPGTGHGLVAEVEVGVQVQDAHPQALADRRRAGHAQVAREGGLVPAAQHHGEAAGVEQAGDGEPGARLAGLQGASGHGDVAGVVHVPVEVEGERTERGADGGGRCRGAGAALVAAHAVVAAEAEDDGGPGGRRCWPRPAAAYGVTACHQRRCSAPSPSNRPVQGCGGTSTAGAGETMPLAHRSPGRKTSRAAVVLSGIPEPALKRRRGRLRADVLQNMAAKCHLGGRERAPSASPARPRSGRSRRTAGTPRPRPTSAGAPRGRGPGRCGSARTR